MVATTCVGAAADSRLEVLGVRKIGDTSTLISQAYPEIVIANTSDGPISFLLRLGLDDWSSQTIPFGENSTYGCRQCGRQNFEIKIRTGDEEVHYTLKSGRRYSIEWDNGQGLWNIFDQTVR